MEISKDALLRIVRAARLSIKVAETVNGFMFGEGKPWSIADQIVGDLEDAIYEMLGEKSDPKSSFSESMTMRLLTGDLSDEAITDYIITLNRLRKRTQGIEEVQQPKPQIISKEAGKRMYVQSGGYQYTPEGEFK